MRDEIRRRLDEEIRFLYERRIVRNFPVQPIALTLRRRDCRYISYENLAAASGRSVQDVVIALGSADGCTNYDPKKNRYLIAVNDACRTRTRVRWTTAHELGHIYAGHFTELANEGKHEASPSELWYMEEEADYFAASLLAPIPAIRKLRAKNADDVRRWFDLSRTAASYRWAEYLQCDGPTVLDQYFRWATAESAVKTGERLRRKPRDIWPEESEFYT